MMQRALDRLGRVFSVRERQMAYTFGAAALRDLALFCRATESCFDPDPRIHAMLEGRREVWLRIAKHCRLNEEQVMTALYTGNPIINNQGE